MSTRTLDQRLGLCIVAAVCATQIGTFLTLPGTGERFRALGAIFAGGRTPGPPPPGGTDGPERVTSVTVPEGDGTPVMTDGIFSPGEWDDARRIALSATAALYLKQHRGVVFLGIKGEGGIGPSDLCLSAAGGPIWKLHVSAQLAEAILPKEGSEPAPRFGLTTDWYANELRRDMAEAERLKQAGMTPIEIIQATSYPSDGIEFAIRRSKLPGDVWLMRLWASSMVGGKPGMLLYPPDTDERATKGWLELRLR